MNVAIVDDEERFLLMLSQKVEAYLLKQPASFQISTYKNGSELLKSGLIFDLIFLDIQMDGLSGMETARRLRSAGTCSYIIFVTILTEYVYDAFEVDASDYLLKPIDDKRFIRMMERICPCFLNRENKSLLVTSKGSTCKFILFHDIYYCEAVNHRIFIHAKDDIHICSIKIEELQCRLDDRFFKCHRSYLINLDYVSGYQDGLAYLMNGERIPVSRLRVQEFSPKMPEYMKSRGC